MKKHPFDKELKKELSEYNSQVDIKNLWSAIEADVDLVNENRKKKKRRFFFFFLFAGVGLVGLIAWGVNTFSSKDLAILPPDKTLQKTAPTTEPSSSTLSAKKEQNTSPAAVKSPLSKANTTANFSLKKSSTKSLSTPPTSKQSFFTPIQKSKTTKAQIKKTDWRTSPKKEKAFAPTKIKKTIPFGQTSSILESKKSTAAVQFLATRSFSTVESIPLKRLSIDYIHLSDIPENETEEERKRKKKSALQFSLGAEVGIGFTQQLLSDTQEPNSLYLQNRKDTESPQENISLGIHAEIIHRSGLAISIGAQYTKITEKLFIDQVYTIFDTIQNGLYGLRINPYGDTIPVYQEIINSKKITTQKVFYNRHQWYQIPVLLGYHWQTSDWDFGVQTGLVANLKRVSTGKILAADGIELIDLGDFANPHFSDALRLSYQLGGSIRYRLQEHWQISINPFFSAAPKLTKANPNYPIQQGYRLFGVRMGSRFIF